VRDHLQRAMQEVYDRATEEDRTRYLELMRNDPVAGMAYLEVLAVQQEPEDRP